MSLFGGVIPVTGITFLIFSVFAISAVGYALGRITIKGVSLGTAGVFIVALVYGCLFYNQLDAQLVDYTKNALKIIENMGLILFVKPLTAFFEFETLSFTQLLLCIGIGFSSTIWFEITKWIKRRA